MNISQQLQLLKKNVQEISTLAEIYCETVGKGDKAVSRAMTVTNEEEVRYVRERILKLSLANKQMLETLETKEKVK